LFLDRAKFADSFAGDVGAEKAAFMAASQVPWGVKALEGAVTEPSWRKKPSWYLVATDDMIPPPAQQMMAKRAGATVVESKGSHAVYVSRPEPSPRSSRAQPTPEARPPPDKTWRRHAPSKIYGSFV
jgi:hypothetical protein